MEAQAKAETHVLVVGGAGYIGSHMCKLLSRSGHRVTVLDNLSSGHRQAVQWGDLVEASAHETSVLDQLFERRNIHAVMQFAASTSVAESVREPLNFYLNNVGGTLELLSAMRRHGVRRFVFSSTASIFGSARYSPIDEQHPEAPISPYGQSKLMVEHMLRDAAAAGHLDAVTLRYFNAAGADPDGLLGEAHDPETHLIPLLIKAALGQVPPVTLFGDDYNTEDGTCVRDYIHIADLCEAHLLALSHMQTQPGFSAFNLGNGKGYSVKEVLAAVERVIGRPVPVTVGPRRPGDPARLIASSALAREKLGWQPKLPDLDSIIRTAWQWHQAPKFGSR